MKKLLSLAAALLLCVGLQAQIVSSRSVSIKSTAKQPSEMQWFLRGGLNIMNFSGDGAEGANSKLGYNFVYGFQKPLSSVGTYWGMDFGVGSRGFKVDLGDDDNINLITHNIQVSPFTFGYKYAITDAFSIDAHIGAYLSFDYMGKIKNQWKEYNNGNYEDREASISMGDWDEFSDDDWKRFDAGMNIGVGIWYNRFNLDFTYQHGFLKTWEANTSNVLIRLGVAF